MNRMQFRRRDVLRLGAASLALAPFARGATARAAGTPLGNLLVFYTPNGHVRSDFGATGVDAGFSLKPSLVALEPWKSKLAIVQDIDNPGASEKASHEDCVRTLTCVPGGDIYKGYGPSIDWVVANHIGQRPITLSSRWAQAPNWQSKISWKASGVFEPHVDSAQTAFADAFGSFTPSQTPSQATAIMAQKKSVLDFVREDIASLDKRLPADEKVKLATHLDALREVEKKIAGVSGGGGGAACSTTALKQRVDAGTAGLSGGEALQRDLEIKLDLLAVSFACGQRRVATLLTQGASAGVNPFGGAFNHHNVSHGEGPDARTQWKKIDAWYAQRFAYLLKKLSDLQVLDQTVVVWATEISEQHEQKGFVIPVAGGAALGIKNGATFTGRNTLSNLWVSVQKALGVPGNSFGAQSSGGIPNLWKPV